MLPLLGWWYSWGAIVFLVAVLFIAALVLFDMLRLRRPAIGWALGVILPVLLILPSILLSILGTDLNNELALAEFFFWMGAFAGLVAVIDAIGYFMLASMQSPRQPPPLPPRGNDGITIRPPDPRRYGDPPQPGRTRPYGDDVGGPDYGPQSGKPRKGVAPAVLHLTNGPAGARQYPVFVGRTTLGRSPESDVMIEDEDVSRDHAHIQQYNGRFAVLDRGSTHGTYVNGKLIRGETYLMDSDKIRLGPNSELVFKQF